MSLTPGGGTWFKNLTDRATTSLQRLSIGDFRSIVDGTHWNTDKARSGLRTGSRVLFVLNLRGLILGSILRPVEVFLSLYRVLFDK